MPVIENGARRERGLRYAVRAARLSDLRSHRVGAALFKGSRYVAMGWNCKKTHPRRSTEWTQHAEFNVFVGQHKLELSGCDLYVARLTRTESVKLAKPCKYCRDFLKTMGLHKIFYSNEDGEIEQLVLNE